MPLLKPENMFAAVLKPSKIHHNSAFLSNSNPHHHRHLLIQNLSKTLHFAPCITKLGAVRASGGGPGNEGEKKKRSFLTLEEAGLVEISGLSTHERFLCRLTISSLNLLRVISEQEGCEIEELNAGKVCDWFVKDKLKREQNLDSAVLQWDDPELF